MHDPIDGLARADKWFLGCGDGIIFAPPFPRWLDAPGFWDDATFFQYTFGPLFTVTFLDHEGRELRAQLLQRLWTPAELTCRYALPSGVEATEVRSVQPGGVFASEWRLHADTPVSLHAVAWTTQDSDVLDVGSIQWNAGSLGYVREVRDRRNVPLRVRAELTCLGGATSWSASWSERTAAHPHWSLAPFAEQWRQEVLPSHLKATGVSMEGQLYAAVHRALPRGVSDLQVTFAMRLSSESAAGGEGRPLRAYTPRSTAIVGAGAATLGGASRRRWREMFDLAPRFACSDPYFERYYWYRWYGLWLNAIAPGNGNYSFPTLCEGIGVFHNPVSYSAPAQVRELRWLADPELARGVLRTMFTHQRDDGSIPGRVYLNHLAGTDFYHADWGGAFEAIGSVAPDAAFVRELYPRLARYADWMSGTRDRESSGLIDVLDQFETGQEFSSRYLAVDANADRYGWENRLRLKGVDATVYAYQLFNALAGCAGRAGEPHDRERWRAAAERTATAVREHMWDADAEIFCDVDPASGRSTGIRAAVGLYPYFTGIAREEHRAGIARTLLDASLFWTTYPVPSAPLSDRFFSAAGEWRGKRHACPWNGRVWPMLNSHIAEALGTWGTVDRATLRRATVHLIRRFIHMMFHDGDVARPNCFEHYNPFTGAASTYRGIDDYQHSWVVDLIIRFVCGLRPDTNGLTVDPFPFDLDLATLDDVHIAGHVISLRLEREGYEVRVDGEVYRRAIGDALRLEWA